MRSLAVLFNKAPEAVV